MTATHDVNPTIRTTPLLYFSLAFTVETVGSTQHQRRRISPARLAFSDTATGCSSVGLVIASPPSCTPLLHRHYPVSALL